MAEPPGKASRLLEHPALWRAGQLNQATEALSTGFPELDAHLPGRGWPRAGLSEFLLDTTGAGELKLLAPLLRDLSRSEARWIAWVNPPFIPYAPALTALGIDVDRMLLIHPRDHKDALWAFERAARSGGCSVVLGWLDEKQLKVKDTRRLQLAARQGRAFSCLFRPAAAAAESSMAELRLKMKALGSGKLEVSIAKRRGGWPVTGLNLTVAEPRRPAEIREQLSLWRSMQHPQDAGNEAELPVLGTPAPAGATHAPSSPGRLVH